MSLPPPDPTPISQILDAPRRHAALIAALELRAAEHLAAGAGTPSELAARAQIAIRGAQVLLDALVALGLASVQGGVYSNTPLADAYLVPSSPYYVGDEQVALARSHHTGYERLTEQLRSGEPVNDIDSDETKAFWTLLTPMIARYGQPVAHKAIEELGLAQGEPHLLDVGGGAALYSLALLQVNLRARATQLDWPHINRMARERVEAAGHGARFTTIDGDLRITDPTPADATDRIYDVAVVSNIMHQESPGTNSALLERMRLALRPGGHLVISEFVVDDGRTGPPSSLLFHMTMLLHSHGGKSYERRELRRIVEDAGFGPPRFLPVGPMSTLIFAKAP